MLDRIAKWVADKAKKLWGGVKATAGKVVAWWKARKAFKIGKVSHELYVSGEQKSARLMVKSTPQTLENVIGTLRTGGPLKEPKKSAVEKIEAEAKNIDKLKAETGGSFGQEAGEKIMQSMTIIAANLAAAGLAAVPKSKVKFNTRNALGDKVGSRWLPTRSA